MNQPPNDEYGGGWFWTNLRIYTPWKAIAALTMCATLVVSCGREGAAARVSEVLVYNSGEGTSTAKATSADAATSAAEAMKELLRSQARRDLNQGERRKFARLRAALDRSLSSLELQYGRDRARLESLRATGALERLRTLKAATSKHKTAWKQAARRAQTGQRSPSAAKALRELDSLIPSPATHPISTSGAFDSPTAAPNRPPLDSAVTPAYATPVDGVRASTLGRAPEPDDLVATGETASTPEVLALATQLGRDPVRIYNFVRNEIRYEPYFGVMRGADETLKQRAGSDADQASLLVALLRASGIASRFVRGTAELSPAVAANWLGIRTESGERADAASEILASGGVPTTTVKVNGEVKLVRFEHVWAEAHVSAEAYRGVGESIGTSSWLALDPSIKPNDITAPTINLREIARPLAEDWGAGFADHATVSNGTVTPWSSSQAAQTWSAMQSTAQSQIDSAGPIDSVTDFLGATRVRRTSASYLPGSLPFQTRSVTEETRGVSRALMSRVSVSVGGAQPLSLPEEDEAQSDLTFSADTHKLAGRRITLGYVPSTATDAEVIDSYHGLLNTPAYAAELTPVLRVDGEVVARGKSAVPVGYSQRLEVVYSSPGFSPDTVTNPVVVGSLSALALAVGTPPASALRDRAATLDTLRGGTTSANLLTDARAGELLSELGNYYFLRNDAYNATLANIFGVNSTRGLSGAILATDLTVRTVGGYPVQASLNGLSIDVDQDVQSVVPKVRDGFSVSDYLRAAATYASTSEAMIFNNVFGGSHAVSTTAVFAAAGAQQIPIIQVTASNVAQLSELINVGPAVAANVAAAVAGGATVIIPTRSVSMSGRPAIGYIVDYGRSLEYRISGGQSGGLYYGGGAPPQIPDFFELFLDAMVTFVKEGEQAVAKRINAIFDAFIEAIAPWVKETADCYAAYADSKKALEIAAVTGAMIGALAFSQAAAVAAGRSQPQLQYAFEAAGAQGLLAAASMYAMQAVMSVLACQIEDIIEGPTD